MSRAGLAPGDGARLRGGGEGGGLASGWVSWFTRGKPVGRAR